MGRAQPLVNVTMPELAEAVRDRREDLHREILERVQAIADPEVPADPEYAAGTRDAVLASLDYAATVLQGAESQPPIPEAVLVQARLAARTGVGLGTVLRRYMAGFSRFAEAVPRIGELSDADRHRLQPALSMHLDFLLARVGEDYSLALESLRSSPRSRRAEAIGLLLAGVPAPRSELAHEWDAWHVGLVGAGASAREALASLGSTGGPGRLLLEQVEGETWAWLSSRKRLQPGEVASRLPIAGAEELALGVGEPGHGLDGWRRSHQQAAAAMPIARRSGPAVALYAEVGVVAAILHDDLLIASLRDRYLAPLGSGGRDETLRRTLRGYLSTECNVSSTAAALGVSRRTVRNRLRRVEERAELRIGECLAELDLAMRIAELRLA